MAPQFSASHRTPPDVAEAADAVANVWKRQSPLRANAAAAIGSWIAPTNFE
jgi:hypothetical protein